jgi:hypothetical protein
MEEILASQRKMLVRRGEPTDRVDDGEMGRLFEKHLAQVYAFMDERDDVEYVDVDYNAALEDPETVVERVVEFLDADLDASAMLGVVDPQLYRQRKGRLNV